jgi:hypothetical protein
VKGEEHMHQIACRGASVMVHSSAFGAFSCVKNLISLQFSCGKDHARNKILDRPVWDHELAQ